jgi:hypothetical protein
MGNPARQIKLAPPRVLRPPGFLRACRARPDTRLPPPRTDNVTGLRQIRHPTFSPNVERPVFHC